MEWDISGTVVIETVSSAPLEPTMTIQQHLMTFMDVLPVEMASLLNKKEATETHNVYQVRISKCK